MDERVLLLRTLIEIHPSLTKYLEENIRAIKQETVANCAEYMKLPYAWTSPDEEDIIRGKLELMEDEELRKYSLEELTSLLKEK